MDDVDRAQAREQEIRDDALAVQRRVTAAADGTIGAMFCADCGDHIPLPRRLAVPGATRCIDCQGFVEMRRTA